MIPELGLAQDPRELFDVVTAEGLVTGRTKPRGMVHRDGDWHRAIHVWVVGIDQAGPFLTFQRRSLRKDTFPGKLDATVGGHYRAGEDLAGTLREVDEEIGITVDLADLHILGTRIAVNESEVGTIDRELQDVFLMRDDRPLSAFRPDPVELDGLVRCPLVPLLGLFAGEISVIDANVMVAHDGTETSASITLADFIWRIDRYPYRVAIAADRFLRGERHIAI